MPTKPARPKKSMGKKLQLIQKSAATERLDIFLRRELPKALGHSISNSEIRRLILSGKTKVRSTKASTPDHLVRRNDQIEVQVTEQLTQSIKNLEQQKRIRIRILYEDPWLIFVEKPSGIPTHPTVDPNRVNLFSLVVSQLKADHQRGAEPYLSIHHRLDRDTSGIVLMVKDPVMNDSISKLFQERMISKTYVAVSAWQGKAPPDAWQVENFLGPTHKIHGKQLYGAVRSGGQHALTLFRTIERLPDRAKIEASPVTGRTHQIRSHLLSSGFPIIGDEWYFDDQSRLISSRRLLLHANRLEMVHPMTLQPLIIESAPDF